MHDSGALTPTLEPLMPDDVQETFTAQQIPLEEADLELARLSADPGFQRIAKEMRDDIDQLRNGKAFAITPNMTTELIGQKYLVACGIAERLEKYLRKVENAQRAVVAKEEADNAAKQQQAAGDA